MIEKMIKEVSEHPENGSLKLQERLALKVPDLKPLSELDKKMDVMGETDLFKEKQMSENSLEVSESSQNSIEIEKNKDVLTDFEKHTPIEGNGGTWSGERGNSIWTMNTQDIPMKSNPENKTWEEIGVTEIQYNEGEPDFSEVMEGSVKIEPYTSVRTDNFDLADKALAEQKGKNPEEIATWRKENKYTWHEKKDMQTMELVPSIVHNNMHHSGGISEIKKLEAKQNV